MTENPPPPGGYPPPPPPGGYPPPSSGGYPPPQGGGYPPPQQGGGYPPPHQGGYPPPQQSGGFPPPQQGGYPPPPSGGFPPPPPPGGYPPPPGGAYPPPQQGYPPMGGGPAAFSVGEAFSWSWNKFTKNAVPLVVSALAFGAVIVVLQGLINLIQMLVSPDTSYTATDSSFAFSYVATGFAGLLVSIVGWFISLIVAAAIQSAFLGGVFDIANGQEVTIGSFFKPRNIGNVVIAGLIVGVITTVGFFLCFVPGLIASILLMFTVVFVLDRNLSPMDAVKASFEMSKAQFSNVLIAWLVMVLVVFAGFLVCGVGALVGVPVASLILVYTYRVLTGGYVAPVTP